jgi:hypothetical protein
MATTFYRSKLLRNTTRHFLRVGHVGLASSPPDILRSAQTEKAVANVPHPRINLLIDTYQGSRPISAHCKKCDTHFRTSPELTPSEAISDINEQYDFHLPKCKEQSPK